MQEIINGSNIWQRGIMLEMNFENFVLDLQYGWWLVFPSYYSCTTDKYLEASITFWFLSRLHLWLITDTNLFSNLVWLHVNNSLAENQEIKSRKMQTFQIMPNFSLCTDQRVFLESKEERKCFYKILYIRFYIDIVGWIIIWFSNSKPTTTVIQRLFSGKSRKASSH